MNDNVILTEKKDAVLLITINRPEKLNALNATVLDALKYTLEIFLKDDALKGAIITGSGEKAFVAGADISGFLKGDRNMGADFAAKGQTLFSSIENASKPIIAAVNGFALGGGCELAMSCHFRIASENAKFGQPEINLGILLALAEAKMKTITSKSSIALTQIIIATNAADENPAEGMKTEAICFGKSFASDDMVEGVTAFLEKRKANFK